MLFTPALTKHYLTCCASDTFIGIKIKNANRYSTQVQKEYEHLLPKIGILPQTETNIESRVARSITPEALALAYSAY